MKLFSIVFICLMVIQMAGCATNKNKTSQNNARREYEASKSEINTGHYAQATVDLEHFSSKYPYSQYTIPAELLRIFSAYKDDEFVLSEVLSKRFIDLHPGDVNIDYAEYMLAMSQYRQRTSFAKDTTENKAAIKSFKMLLKDHPNSPYAKQGRVRLQSLYNSLAKHELSIGKYYFDRDRLVAAANRFQEVVRHYQTTASIEEALYYLAASYAKMNMPRYARQTAQLLRYNFPNNSWSSKAEQFR